MAHFVDQFRYKFDKENQIVLFSVLITEHRVIEHTIPVLLFWNMSTAYRSDQNYSSSFLKTKTIDNSVLLTIRENDFTRRSYKFNNSEFNRLISQFRRNVDMTDIDESVEFDPSTSNSPNLGNITKEIAESMQSILSSQPNDMTAVIERIDSLEQISLKLSKQLTEITGMIKSLQENGISQITQSSIKSPIPDMPLFIPSTVNTDFNGRVDTKTQQSEDQNVTSATKLLKKMKKNKGKNK
jgi:hypothetical protein